MISATSRACGYGKNVTSIHAERAVIKKATHLCPVITKKGRGWTLKVSYGGSSSTSRPCKACTKLLRNVIPKATIEYTVNGVIHRSRPCDIVPMPSKSSVERRSGK